MHFLFFESEFRLKFNRLFTSEPLRPTGNATGHAAGYEPWNAARHATGNGHARAIWHGRRIPINFFLNSTFAEYITALLLWGKSSCNQFTTTKNDQTFTLGNYSCSFKCFIFFHPTYMKCTKKINFINAKSICSTKTILHTVHALFF